MYTSGLYFFAHGFSEHHVVVIKSGGNIRCPSEKPKIPPRFKSQLHDVQTNQIQKNTYHGVYKAD